MRPPTKTGHQVGAIAARDDQRALMRGLVNGVVLSAALWATAIYIATVLR